nr:unnamed protein product [Callosobruchus analis]
MYILVDDTLKAINLEAGLDLEKDIYKTPTVAFNIGTLLKQTGNILVAESIKKHDEEKKKNVENYLLLLTQDMNTCINRTVVESQYQEQRRKKVQLPTSEDIRCLCDYLAVKRNDAFDFLKKNFLYMPGLTYAKQLSHPYRRRAGEAERILIEHFKSYISINKENDKELYESLSKQDQSLATYVRFLIRGKLNRNVPVLLDQHLLACVELIVEHRKSAKVSDINPYVFVIQSNEKNRYK